MIGVCSKAIWVLINLLCAAFFTLQLVHILEGYARPTVTRTWEEEVFLQDIDFPLTIKICVIPGFNQTALNESGYDDTWFYFLGQSAFNDSIYGWAGHTEGLGTVDTVDKILSQVVNYQIEDIFGELYVWTRDQELVNRVYQNVKKLSESLCLLIYIGPIYMQPISAKKMIFGAFSSLGHLFLVFGLLRG